ncbi:MAG: hypothetical protein ACR2JC_02145 [Chloroflexota bacterium]
MNAGRRSGSGVGVGRLGGTGNGVGVSSGDALMGVLTGLLPGVGAGVAGTVDVGCCTK